MTEISIAYCSSHAPMMAAARDSAEENQRNRFFGALEIIRDDARRAGVQACVVLSNEHFTNFFLENFPQICVGVGEPQAFDQDLVVIGDQWPVLQKGLRLLGCLHRIARQHPLIDQLCRR